MVAMYLSFIVNGMLQGKVCDAGLYTGCKSGMTVIVNGYPHIRKCKVVCTSKLWSISFLSSHERKMQFGKWRING